MRIPGQKLTVTTPSDREVQLTRLFNAPPALVYEAHTRPELVKRWLGVGYVDGWSLAVCEIDLRVGGAYRYLWRGPNGAEMGMRGILRELVPGQRIVATEKFDESWYPGEAVSTTMMKAEGNGTRLTITVKYESREARDIVLQTPMAEGMGAGYDTLAAVLAEQAGIQS